MQVALPKKKQNITQTKRSQQQAADEPVTLVKQQIMVLEDFKSAQLYKSLNFGQTKSRSQIDNYADEVLIAYLETVDNEADKDKEIES